MRRVAVYAGTRNVYPMMVIAAKSLLSHTRIDRVWFLIEDDAFPEEFGEMPDVIRCMNISKQEYFPEDGPNYSTPWTYMSLMRLALPDLLKEETRCIWLDNDTIVTKDIGPLTDIDMEGNYVAMVEEPVRSLYPFKYHNAGVMVMDLDTLRKDGTWKKWIRIVNSREYTAPDQDAVNLICQGEILTAGPEWNHAPGIVGESPDPAIRHYCGCQRTIGNDWFDYYRKADWRVTT